MPPLDHTPTQGELICPYCGVGCRLWGEAGYGKMMRVKGVADAPANLGRFCAKGATLPETVHTSDRLAFPLLRRDRNSPLERASWDTTLDHIAGRLRKIIAEHGPDSVGFYGSGQLDSQAVYSTVKLFKGSLGTNNTDSNSRLCMATAVAAYRTSLGADGPPTCYDDIDEADVVFIAGSNMAEAHPVTYDRLRAARKARPHMRIVVVDPRRSKTAAEADFHLALKPGSDIALFNALALLLIDYQAIDCEFVDRSVAGVEEFFSGLMQEDLPNLAAQCGIAIDELRTIALLLGPKQRLLSFYCMGLGQSTVGMWKINALLNLHLLTGSIGKPGCGPFSLTGQPNAMGGREIGLLAHQLPAHRFVDNATHRAEVERHWQLPAGSISATPGLTAVEMFRSLERKQLKAIWIAATNPVVSLPDVHHVRRALASAELVIVQDAFHPTETSQLADVVLPAASWAEREWTSTSSERLVSHSEKIVDPPGEALPDWQILCRVAQRMGFGGFDFRSAGEVWDEWIALSRGRGCDMAGMSAARLARERHLQWPCPDAEHSGTKRLYTDGKFPTPTGRAMLHYRTSRPPAETTDHEFPFVLTTGRVYAHWHTQTRTGKVKKLVHRDPEPYVEMNPQDARRVDLDAGDLAQISSRRGTIRLKVRLDAGMQPGLVFIPMHWGDQLTPGAAVNYLTISAIGRVAKQPELKHCAISIERAEPRAKSSGTTKSTSSRMDESKATQSLPRPLPQGEGSLS